MKLYDNNDDSNIKNIKNSASLVRQLLSSPADYGDGICGVVGAFCLYIPQSRYSLYQTLTPYLIDNDNSNNNNNNGYENIGHLTGVIAICSELGKYGPSKYDNVNNNQIEGQFIEALLLALLKRATSQTEQKIRLYALRGIRGINSQWWKWKLSKHIPQTIQILFLGMVLTSMDHNFKPYI